MRKPVIAGNWKMNMTIAEAVEFVNAVKGKLNTDKVEAVLCAPFTILKDLVKATEGTDIGVGAQNMHFADSGAYTGEVSVTMLKEIGVKYVVIGHSERRQYFAETDETVNKKVIKALESDLIPIMCVGESLEEREAGKAFDVIKTQTVAGFANISAADAEKVILAYEPIWAIGTGKTASSEDANDAIAHARKTLAQVYGQDTADKIRIQYGGSVKTDNVSELMGMSDIDGALVGGASLKADDYIKLVNF